MRFMIPIKASRDSQAGVMPTKQLLTEMGQFNEELIKVRRYAGWRGWKRATSDVHKIAISVTHEN